MNHLSFLCCFLILKLGHLQITNILLSESKENGGYAIGDKVSITCVVRGERKLSVLIRHNDVYKSENGLCHSNQYKCDNLTVGGRRHFILTIDSLAWSDHGEWLCIQGKSFMKGTIVIKVPGKVKPLAAMLKYRESKQHPGYIPEMLYGKGLRTNPYDLMTGVSMQLHCSTGCSNPKSEHEWSYRNLSMSSKFLTVTNISISHCRFLQDGEGSMVVTTVLINCDSLSMVGSNQVTCTMTDSTDSQSVFVLCPGGHKPWTLTNGEIIGISIAVGIAALIIVTLFFSAKRVVNSYRYGAVGQGIQV